MTFDPMNRYAVALHDGFVITMLPPHVRLTKEEAQSLGIWLVAFGFDFDAGAVTDALQAVLST